MKTDEERPEYLVDALEMVGAGYGERPTVIIDPPRVTTVRRGGKMVEEEEPAWVKFSTDFKKELKTIDEYSLKVFLYIGLSINWRNGEAWPGVRLIAEETGIAPNTVTKAVSNLEQLGFMTVYRREGSSNIYTPVRYVSIGTVARDATVPSQGGAKPSHQNAELSHGQERNLHNKSNKKKNTYASSSSPKRVIRPLVPDMPADLTEGEQFEWQLTRVVNLIDYQNAGTGALAEAFMRTRGIVFMEKDVKEQRNIASDLIKQKVKPEHVIAATEQIMGLKDKTTGRPYTCTSLKHIKQTAISLANPAPAKGQRGGQANGGWTGTNPL